MGVIVVEYNYIISLDLYMYIIIYIIWVYWIFSLNYLEF